MTIVFGKPVEQGQLNEIAICALVKQLGVDGVGVDDVTIITDNNGHVTCVVVRIVGNNTHDKAQALVTALERELDKGGECAAGVLCRATDVLIGCGLPSGCASVRVVGVLVLVLLCVIR